MSRKAGRVHRNPTEQWTKDNKLVISPFPFLRSVYAVAAASVAFSSLKRTDTSFDTPGSCMVTP